MNFLPQGELRSDILAGLKHGVLVAAAALVVTLPPSGLATLRSVPPSAAATIAPLAPIDRPGPFRAADFGTRVPTADVRYVADWVADSHDSGGLPYVILDKRDARVWVFAPDGRLIDASPVLLGATPGDDSAPDIGTRPISLVKQEEKTTPAGRFVSQPGRNASGEEVIWVDYGAAVSMHRVRIVDPKERRLERLASGAAEDRRISYGCINIPVEFFDAVMKPMLGASPAVVYVLPERKALADVFPASAAARNSIVQSPVHHELRG